MHMQIIPICMSPGFDSKWDSASINYREWSAHFLIWQTTQREPNWLPHMMFLVWIHSSLRFTPGFRPLIFVSPQFGGRTAEAGRDGPSRSLRQCNHLLQWYRWLHINVSRKHTTTGRTRRAAPANVSSINFYQRHKREPYPWARCLTSLVKFLPQKATLRQIPHRYLLHRPY